MSLARSLVGVKILEGSIDSNQEIHLTFSSLFLIFCVHECIGIYTFSLASNAEMLHIAYHDEWTKSSKA